MTTNQHTDPAARSIELSESDLENVTAAAMAATMTTIKTVSVREDPCAGGQVTIFKR